MSCGDEGGQGAQPTLPCEAIATSERGDGAAAADALAASAKREAPAEGVAERAVVDHASDGSEWDPPCTRCGVVPADHRNVVCDGCAHVYHWACVRPTPLLALPTEAEWFCQSCLKHGIIETVLERHGRGPDACYLVKWRGRVHDVAWMSARDLDISSWAREQMRSFCAREAARAAAPVAHPLGAEDARLARERRALAAELATDEARLLRALLDADAFAEPRARAPTAVEARARVRELCCRRLSWWAAHLPTCAAAGASPAQPPASPAAARALKRPRATSPGGAAAALAAAAARNEGGGSHAGGGGGSLDCDNSACGGNARSELEDKGVGSGGGSTVAPPSQPQPSPPPPAPHTPRPAPLAPPSLPHHELTRRARLLFTTERARELRAEQQRTRTEHTQPQPEHAAATAAAAAPSKRAAAEWIALPSAQRDLMRARVSAALGQVPPPNDGDGDAAATARRGVATCEPREALAAALAGADVGESLKLAALTADLRTAATAANRKHALGSPPPRVRAPDDSSAAAAAGSAARRGARAAGPPRCALCLGGAEKRALAECARCGAQCHLACVHPPLAEPPPPTLKWECPLCAPPPPPPLHLHPTTAGARAAVGALLGAAAPARAVGDAAAGALELFASGLVTCEQGLTEKQVERCAAAVLGRFESAMRRVSALDLGQTLIGGGFDALKLRHHGRYDVAVPELAERPFRFTREEAPWMALVRATLGADASLVHCGCMLSLPGSATQPWHSDGDHLSELRHFAPHCLNVFVPLVPLSRDNGPTEFIPRSHSSWEAAEPSVVPTLAAGGYLVFDYRLRHRGLGNRSGEARPLLYLTYAKPFFADVTNFNAKRYPALPEIDEWHGRDERARKREHVRAKRVA